VWWLGGEVVEVHDKRKPMLNRNEIGSFARLPPVRETRQLKSPMGSARNDTSSRVAYLTTVLRQLRNS
jgi:hypothetical protein